MAATFAISRALFAEVAKPSSFQACDVQEELLRIVKDEAVDLIVMGTHGRRTRWFLGSVTEHILRKVPLPVVTVSHTRGTKHEVNIVPLK